MQNEFMIGITVGETIKIPNFNPQEIFISSVVFSLGPRTITKGSVTFTDSGKNFRVDIPVTPTESSLPLTHVIGGTPEHIRIVYPIKIDDLSVMLDLTSRKNEAGVSLFDIDKDGTLTFTDSFKIMGVTPDTPTPTFSAHLRLVEYTLSKVTKGNNLRVDILEALKLIGAGVSDVFCIEVKIYDLERDESLTFTARQGFTLLEFTEEFTEVFYNFEDNIEVDGSIWLKDGSVITSVGSSLERVQNWTHIKPPTIPEYLLATPLLQSIIRSDLREGNHSLSTVDEFNSRP